MEKVVIIGGGLAVSEAAWQVAKRGVNVDLYEMRPVKKTGAHITANLAELVCSNSLGSNLPDRPSGILLFELDKLDSLLINCAKKVMVPAGHAFAVDRIKFSELITKEILEHPRIRLIREEIKGLPDGLCIIASGPLTSPKLARSLEKFTGTENLFFYDAISPTVEVDSIDFETAFWGSRYGKGVIESGDYINCPFNENHYDKFVNELVDAERYSLKDFETDINSGVVAGKNKFFEGCLPIEVMAQRGHHTLAYGPMRPVGLTNPYTGKRPYAVVQLRREDIEGRYFNLVGFQTNLIQKEQERVFCMIPGLEKAVFTRYGQMHRNTFIYSPDILKPTLQSIQKNNLFFAGQITGVEGYLACIATGLLAGINAALLSENSRPICFPDESMIGALCKCITDSSKNPFQPVKESFGILPSIEQKIQGKRNRHKMMAERAHCVFEKFIEKNFI